MKKYAKYFKAFREIISLLIKLKPITIFWMILNAIFKTGNVLLNIYIPKLAIDFLMGKNWDNFIVSVLYAFLAKFLLFYIGEFVSQNEEHSRSLFNDMVAYSLSEKSMNIKYYYLENPESLELKEAALATMTFGTFQDIIRGVAESISALFTIIGIVSILISFSFTLFVVVTFLSILGLIVEAKLSTERVKFIQDLIPINRRMNYYFDIIAFNKERQKDCRLYRIDEPIIEKTDKYNKEIADRYGFMNLKKAQGASFSTILNVMSSFILYTYAGLRVLGFLGKKIPLGDFAVLINSNESYSNSLKSFGVNLVAVLAVLPMMEPLTDFLALEEMDEGVVDLSKKLDKLKSLTFENVTFAYPKTDKKILDWVSFTLNEGEILSIVGRNNSGKSTIVKLICRLFEPDEGRILWNGVDIREFPYANYLEELSTVFQDFKLFPLRIWENIASTWSGNEKNEDEKLPINIENKINDIIKKIDLDEKISKLPSGIYNWLDKNLNEDATELSGGQRQKLAIGRAIFQDSSVAILDEPTAALDPLAEAETYENFADLVKGKTAIFISHRMSASKFSDRILILEDGKITGNGRHEDLLKTNKLYKDLHQAQAQYYE